VSIPTAAPAQVFVEPDTATLTGASQTVQLAATVIDTNGDTIGTPSGTWTSRDEGVATVSGDGLVTAVADGTAAVVYALGAIADSAEITVATGPPPAALFTIEHDAGWPQDDVWGTGPGDYWSVGYSGSIMRDSGSGWENATPGVTDARLSSIWGAATDDVWAAGQFGEIVHYDGSSWSTAASPTANWILDMEGLAADDIWGVGQSGTIVHYDGSSWGTVGTPTSQTLQGVYPVASDDVWAVGDNGVILHYDGVAWASVTHGTGSIDFKDIVILAADDIWVNGPGSVVHYDGVSWSVAQSGLPTFTEMWAAGPSQAWGVSNGAQFAPGEIWFYDGSSWADVTPLGNVIGRFNGIFGTSGSHVRAVGQTTGGGAGIVAWHWDGSTWSDRSGGVIPMAFGGSWGSGPDDVWAVSDRLGIVHFDGTQWTDESVGLSSGQGFFSIWGSAADDIWAVGGSSTQMYHYDGVSWSNAAPGGAITGPYGVHDVWGSTSSDVWAVQPLGRVIRWNGTSWTQVTHGLTTDPLYAVWGSGPNDVFIAGGSSAAVIIHWDGADWSDVSPGGSGSVRELWGSGPDDVYAVGNGIGTIHWDGSTWSSVSTPIASPVSIEGSAANDVWITGGSGGIAHWDGSTWTDVSVTLLPDRSFTSVWLEPGVADGTVWVFGAAGLIARGAR
jgi:hypothetical protein